MDDNIICSKCSYSLRGLKDAGECPECGSFYSVRSGHGIERAVDPKLENFDDVARSRMIQNVLFAVALACFVAGVRQAPFFSDAVYFVLAITFALVLTAMLIYERLREGPRL